MYFPWTPSHVCSYDRCDVAMLKEKAVNWYLKNIEMPKMEIQDHPGFMGEDMGGKDIYLRDVAIPEEVFVKIEDKIDKPQLLYRIGKEFGHRYAQVSELKRYSDVDKEELKDSTYGIMKYMESVSYWNGGVLNIDYENKIQVLELDEFIECSKNGKGRIFLGAAAGLWSYIAEDNSIEAVQEECQGRGDEKCIIKCAPKSKLDGNIKADIVSSELNILEDYRVYNKISETDYAENSMEDFKEIGFFEYREGLFYHNDFRYIWTESSLIELVGSELGVDYEEELFNSAFQVGKEIVAEDKERNMEKFIVEYLSATGWGDTKINKKNGAYHVHSLMFPWTRFTDDTSFPVFRGLVSGMITEFGQEEVRLNKVQKDDKGGTFSLLAEED